MGYSLRIGEYCVEVYEEGTDEEEEYETVRETKLDYAPQFPGDDLTANSNYRAPSYTAWNEFCRRVPLMYDLMYETGNGVGPLIPTHPAIVELKPEHLEGVRQSLLCYRAEIGTHVLPGYKLSQEEMDKWGDKQAEGIIEGAEYDYDLARLLWLEFWIEWALNNCTRPVFKNS